MLKTYTSMLFLLLALGLKAQSICKIDSTVKKKIDSTYLALIKENNVKGLSLAIVENGEIDIICIHSIDRLARNLKNLLDLIEFFHNHNVCVHIENMGLKTLVDGKMNYTIKMLINVMGGFAEIENEIRKERQMEGIELAKMKGVYKNRKQRGRESVMVFLSKHEKPLQLIQKGYKSVEISKICDIHPNTLTKIRKFTQLV